MSRRDGVVARHTLRAVICALVSGVAALVLGILVARHVTQGLDVTVGHAIRPPGVWGPWQQRADHVVEAARPSRLAPLLILVGVAWSVGRRSWRPLLLALAVGGAGAALVLVGKAAFGRPDPGGYVAPHSGSFPSGHTAAVVLCLGGMFLVVTTRTRWWRWLVVYGAGAAMGVALLLEGAHWPTDVVGGALVATTALAAASAWRLRGPSTPQPPPAPPRRSGDPHLDANSSAAWMREMHLRRVGPMLPIGIPSTSAISL